MSCYVLGFEDIDKTKIMVVGGKGANLGGNLQGCDEISGCISLSVFSPLCNPFLANLTRLTLYANSVYL
jgi:hypothetical protein